MTESWIRDCEQLVYRAARLTDLGRWEELAAMYLKDGKLLRPSDPDNPIVGRQAILDSLRARPPRVTRHLLGNILVQATSATAAHVSSTVILFSGAATGEKLPVKGQKALVGHFEDDVVLAGDTWAFAVRQGSMVLEYDFAPRGS